MSVGMPKPWTNVFTSTGHKDQGTALLVWTQSIIHHSTEFDEFCHTNYTLTGASKGWPLGILILELLSTPQQSNILLVVFYSLIFFTKVTILL